MHAPTVKTATAVARTAPIVFGVAFLVAWFGSVSGRIGSFNHTASRADEPRPAVADGWSDGFSEPTAPTTAPPNPLFAFCVGMHDSRYRDPAAQAQLMADLGFDGMARIGLSHVGETLAALDRHGLKLFGIYTSINLDREQPPFDPELIDVFEQLAGRETIVWLHTLGRSFEPSSPAGDRRAVAIIQHLADRAARYDVRLALYPHAGLWLQRPDDALRVAAKVGRKNVGVTFNLCHWLKTADREPYELILHRAMPRLMLVTLNGAETGGDSWSELIRTLDEGDFDIEAFLLTLGRLGYEGPIGLQTFGIRGDERANLQRSIAAWRRYTARVATRLER